MIVRRNASHRLPAIVLAAFSLGLVSNPYALADYATVTVKHFSSSLNGTVHAGDGEIREKVSVAVCYKGLHQCSETAVTDKSGHFLVAPHKDQKTYYLEFLLNGMDPEQVIVTLKRGAGPLDIKMIVAT